MAGNRRTAALTAAGAVVTIAAVIGLTLMGYHFDATGGGPSDGLLVLLWGGLLLGVVLLVSAFVRWARTQ